MTDVPAASENRQEQARQFFDQRRWRELWQFNRTCKKSWKALGFTPREIERIKLNKPDWL